MHHAWAWAKEQSARGNKVLNWHITPNMREAQYSGVQSPSATGILNGLLRRLVTPRGFRAGKTACYSAQHDGISRSYSQRVAAVQVLVASHRRTAANRGLFLPVLTHGHAVVCALPHGGSGVGRLAVGIGIQAGSDRVAGTSTQSDGQSEHGCAGRTQACASVGTASLCLDFWR